LHAPEFEAAYLDDDDLPLWLERPNMLARQNALQYRGPLRVSSPMVTLRLIHAFAKGIVRSISFCLIRTMAASPLSRPFGSARQQLS
jgi:hypothetical protein